jgi:SAM-dependent methyltransferase
MSSLTRPAAPSAGSELGRLNVTEWSRSRYVGYYSHRQLRPVEIVLLTRFAEDFAGRVVELGCGAGRVTGYLAETAREVHGIDLSPPMLAAARARFPQANFIEGDIRDLSPFESGSVDVVFGTCNILDVFEDDERRLTLQEIRRALRPGGLLVMSSHNRAYAPRIPSPTRVRFTGPRALIGDLTHLPLRVSRHRRLSAMERDETDYAIINNDAHDFSLVHYFVTPEAQRRQLEEEGFEPLAVLDLEGRELGPADTAPECLELHYVARAR